ncbi:LLM class flavin-dependent oxidoreductase [Bartonella apis]|uniref:LLM class flavin-dependent oxidoreductase n=1 Tax=Bartonella apis TaxID=1686310 RepID=UPI0009688268|nr:LLM class flavin-dependent oxidoreductase [Bartonella apis]MCT6861345.1 LLM class flavin-dependent oxidoreductase [Bartonella apis]OLY45734.1 luciferase family oxidoreductase, group 1 [Bartonella apis]OLY47322.1 luciferase family oxidoreductase, group 1 [Bartonella apis]
MKISVLDLCPVPEGSSVAQALKNSIALAKHVDELGFPRIWYAEHHNMTGIASAATAVVMGQILASTNKIVVGAGGVMLPNHSPLVIAEQFGTLEALYPKRVELGLGRAPGTDQMTARALRRSLDSNPNDYPRDVVELLDYFKDAEPQQQLRAVPGAGLHVPVWILGSSLYGAQLAAVLGLPYSFASHFAPAELYRALKVYRDNFQPSEYLDKPVAMVAANVVVAETDDEAKFLFSSQQQSFVNLRTGRAGPLPKPVMNYVDNLPFNHRLVLEQSLSCSVVGSSETVELGLKKLIADTNADELIVTSPIWDNKKRMDSFTLLARIIKNL